MFQTVILTGCEIEAYLRGSTANIRKSVWKQWKTAKKRIWGLTKLGINPWQAKLMSGFKNRYMVVSKMPAIKKAISKEKLTKRGSVSVFDYYQKVHI